MTTNLAKNKINFRKKLTKNNITLYNTIKQYNHNKQKNYNKQDNK